MSACLACYNGRFAVDDRGYVIFFSTPVMFLQGPLFYFYARALLGRSGGSRLSRVVHFLPAILIAVNCLPAYSGVIRGAIAIPPAMPSAPSQFLPIHGYLSWGLQLAQLAAYLVATHRLFGELRDRLRERESRSTIVEVDWLRRFATALGVLLVVSAISMLTMILARRHAVAMEYLVSLALTGIVHLVGVAALRHPRVLGTSADEQSRSDEAGPTDPSSKTEKVVAESFPSTSVEQVSSTMASPVANGSKYVRSGFPAADAPQIRVRLLDHMQRARPYLDPELGLSDLAESVGLSANHLSQLLNQELGMSYFDFINGYRVEEAKRMLVDPATRHLTILAIAFEAGFSSKGSFNRIFKERTGSTPSGYMKGAQIPDAQ
ncbi:MAG: helix-turn-helix transcriptional regulator [Candidatus Eisenbacteria bacterium]|uniref:Helix-turn-helix transcriptional regulator n=1 Tax=Eiseniibacteriota bacterium TaxID=2212470 RepID=A0A956M313_UNCEI|nr:helix-turn-helix transcriptional regulator [Candidatus Eisenbacteria bacterium]